MTKNKSNKQALLLSALALLMCVFMLVGSTFAWFSDDISSQSNKIVAGTLDVQLLLHDGYDYVDISNSTTPIFSDGTVAQNNNGSTLWEPGKTQVAYLAIKNNGSLALKYSIGLDVKNVSKNLFEVMQYDVVDNAQYGSVNSWTNGHALELGNQMLFKDVSVGVGETKYFALCVHMDEDAKNEYQGGEVNFTLNILAKQSTSESDAFNNEYDEDAAYPVITTFETVSSSTSFEQIAQLIEQGKNIYVSESINLTDGGSGNTYITTDEDILISIADNATISFDETAIITGDGKITVYGGAFKTNHELCVSDNSTLVFEGGEHSLGAFSATQNGKIIVNDGTLNCRGSYAGVMGIAFKHNGQLIVNGGTMNMYQPFNMNHNDCDAVYVEINGGTINLLGNNDKVFAVRNILDKDRQTNGVLRGSSVKITGGVFTTEYQLDSTGDANAFVRNEDPTVDTNRVIISNTYNGQPEYNCVITGGTFYGCWTRTGETGGDGSEVCENTIEGFVADGYKMTGNATNGYIVVKE